MVRAALIVIDLLRCMVYSGQEYDDGMCETMKEEMDHTKDRGGRIPADSVDPVGGWVTHSAHSIRRERPGNNCAVCIGGLREELDRTPRWGIC